MKVSSVCIFSILFGSYGCRNSDSAERMLRAGLVSSNTDVSTSSYEAFELLYLFNFVWELWMAKLGICGTNVEDRFSFIEHGRKHVEL